MLNFYLSRLIKNRMAMAGLMILSVIILVALFAPWIAPYPPNEMRLLDRLAAPSAAHWLGTDDLGRDVLTRMMYGTRVSLLVGFLAVSICVIIGSILGVISGYSGKWIDSLIMRSVDIMLSIPTIFLILAVVGFLSPSLTNVMIVIGLTSWPGLTRLVRGECLSLKEREFVLAAKSVGVSTPRILFLHILPSITGPILVAATLGVGGAILTESALSFLGLGVQPPTASWGNLLAIGRDYLHIAWWLSIYPALAILITVLAFNLLGEGLKEVVHPK